MIFVDDPYWSPIIDALWLGGAIGTAIGIVLYSLKAIAEFFAMKAYDEHCDADDDSE